MRSPLPFPCVPDRPYKILLAQVGTLSFSHPLFGVSVLFILVLTSFHLLLSYATWLCVFGFLCLRFGFWIFHCTLFIYLL